MSARPVEVLADSDLYEVARVVDGDTLLGRRLTLTGHDDDDETLTRDRRPRRLRLVTVNAPEKATDPAGWLRFRLLLLGWLDGHRGRVRCRSYEVDGFGRVLVDLYDPTTGDTASAHLIAEGCPLYAR